MFFRDGSFIRSGSSFRAKIGREEHAAREIGFSNTVQAKYIQSKAIVTSSNHDGKL
jgi:hypothetical protein